MKKALIIMIVLLDLFLAIGCMGNKPVTLNETVTPKQAFENEIEIIGGLILYRAWRKNSCRTSDVDFKKH